MKTIISCVCIIQNSRHLSLAILYGRQSNAEFSVIREKSVLIPVNRARHPAFPTISHSLSPEESLVISTRIKPLSKVQTKGEKSNLLN